MSNSYVGRHRAVIPHRQVGRHRVTRPGLHGWPKWLKWAAVNERIYQVYHGARNLTSVLGFLSRFALFADGKPRARRAAKPIESSAVHATDEPHHQRYQSRAHAHAYAGALVHASSVGAP
jgi:hypothetical protein